MAEIILEKIDRVALVTLNSPDTANAMDLNIGQALYQALEELNRDRSLKAAVLTGAGRTFSAGANIRAILAGVEQDGRTPGQVLEMFVDAFTRAGRLMREMDLPFVAAVNGAASGGGLALALACDVIVAAPQATFDPAYVRLGLVPVGGLSAVLGHLLGPKKAAEFLFMARAVPADQALSMGLINRVVPSDKVVAEALDMARTMAAQPGLGLARTKRLLNQAYAVDFESQLQKEKEYLRECGDHPEHRDIFSALLKTLS